MDKQTLSSKCSAFENQYGPQNISTTNTNVNVKASLLTIMLNQTQRSSSKILQPATYSDQQDNDRQFIDQQLYKEKKQPMPRFYSQKLISFVSLKHPTINSDFVFGGSPTLRKSKQQQAKRQQAGCSSKCIIY